MCQIVFITESFLKLTTSFIKSSILEKVFDLFYYSNLIAKQKNFLNTLMYIENIKS